MNDFAIRAEGLSKLYRIGQREPYKALRDTLSEMIRAPFRAMHSAFNAKNGRTRSEPREDTIWALKDVSFEVNRGETLGIIGRNGAGKSTLLKILSRITRPTRGHVEIRGRVGSLLEVGTGFHPELTGRENIYLNAAILGMKKAEILRKFDEIVSFADIERFIDTPVKHYSSGMYMRLAFSVAAHLEPEILLVDEVLAVGDAAFQKKCLGKMSEVGREGRTVLFVSHNMAMIQHLCSRLILLDKGKIVAQGLTEKVVDEYLRRTKENEMVHKSPTLQLDQDHQIVVTKVYLTDQSGGRVEQIKSGMGCNVVLAFERYPKSTFRRPNVHLTVFDHLERRLFGFSNRLTQETFDTLPQRGAFLCSIPSIPLAPGSYLLEVAISILDGDYVWLFGPYLMKELEVVASDFYGTGVGGANSPILVDGRWKLVSDSPLEPIERRRR